MPHTMNESLPAHERQAISLDALDRQFRDFREKMGEVLNDVNDRLLASESREDEILTRLGRAEETLAAMSTPAAPAPPQPSEAPAPAPIPLDSSGPSASNAPAPVPSAPFPSEDPPAALAP